ncbi:MAG: hypothetical protein ACXVVU_23965 [Solirubrobacteraceae bacterium]
MSDDFIEVLALQLREADHRKARRGAWARAAATARARAPQAPWTPVVAAVLVGAILIGALVTVATLRPEPQAPPAPRVLTRFAPADSLGEMAGGFGSAWLDDTARRQLLRIDSHSREVTARIPVRGAVGIGVAYRAVWVLESSSSEYGLLGPLSRIDPRTNHIVARIPLRTPAGARFRADSVIAARGVLWVVGADGALRVDPRTNRITGAVALGSAYEIRGDALVGGDLWLSRSDGRILRFDARTGRPEPALRVPAGGALSTVGDAVVMVVSDDVAHQVVRLDPASGRVLWRRSLRAVGPSVAAGGLMWIPTVDGRTPDLDLVGIDPGTGATVAHVRVSGVFQPTDLALVGSDLWLSGPGGQVVVVGRLP